MDAVVADAMIRENVKAEKPETLAMLNKKLGGDIAEKIVFVDKHLVGADGRCERKGIPYVQVNMEKLQALAEQKGRAHGTK